jgi:hypothetical protein
MNLSPYKLNSLAKYIEKVLYISKIHFFVVLFTFTHKIVLSPI